MILLTYLYFLILVIVGWSFLHLKQKSLCHPLVPNASISCTGTELFLILTFATGAIGLLPLLSIRLAFLELFCVIALFHSSRKIFLNLPLALYSLFLVWLLMGLAYTPSLEFGIRMILKYLYPFLLALLCYSVVRDREIFLKAALGARFVAMLSVIIYFVPFLGFLFPGVLWTAAAMATHYITICIFSLGLYLTLHRKKDLYYAILFGAPCLIWVVRTNIMGTTIALASFFLIKYRLRALPVIGGIAILGIGALFYIPSVKQKMFFRPDDVTLTKFLTGNVEENNFNMSGRKRVWQDCTNYLYKGNEVAGQGTGCVQYHFYEVYTDWRRGGQLHNDFLVLLCDNGITGLVLYLLPVIAIYVHCLLLYNRKESSPFLKLCCITAGSSLLGVTATMYSDNTISYSMVTLAYPWGFYGMALGLLKGERNA